MVSQFWISKGTKRNQNYFREGLFEFFYDNNVCCRLILEADDQAIHHWTYEKTPYCMQRISFYWKLNSPFLADLFFFPLGSRSYKIQHCCLRLHNIFSEPDQPSEYYAMCMTFMQWGNCSCGIPILVLFLSQIYQN